VGEPKSCFPAYTQGNEYDVVSQCCKNCAIKVKSSFLSRLHVKSRVYALLCSKLSNGGAGVKETLPFFLEEAALLVRSKAGMALLILALSKSSSRRQCSLNQQMPITGLHGKEHCFNRTQQTAWASCG
jgi:hypothetical protein